MSTRKIASAQVRAGEACVGDWVGSWWGRARRCGGVRSWIEHVVKRVQRRTMTICTEAKINREMARNGLRMHLPRANNT